jgi:hypothetical protein
MGNLGNKVIMTHLLSIFHDPDYTCLIVSQWTMNQMNTYLDLMTPLFVDLLLRLLPLFTSFDLTSHLHNLQFREIGGKRLVE